MRFIILNDIHLLQRIPEIFRALPEQGSLVSGMSQVPATSFFLPKYLIFTESYYVYLLIACLTYSRTSVSCVLTCSLANVPSVLTCSRTTCLVCLRAHVATYLASLRTHVLTCLIHSRVLRASVLMSYNCTQQK